MYLGRKAIDKALYQQAFKSRTEVTKLLRANGEL